MVLNTLRRLVVYTAECSAAVPVAGKTRESPVCNRYIPALEGDWRERESDCEAAEFRYPMVTKF